MKKVNLKSLQNQISRDEMRKIIAGTSDQFDDGGSGGSVGGDDENTAWVLCNDGSEIRVHNCKYNMDYYCRLNGGAKICSGGPDL